MAAAVKKKRKKSKKKTYRLPIVLLSILLVLELCYAVAAYSNIPFVVYWRTIYIETAMNTLNHKWLATWFLPKSEIDRVMGEISEHWEEQEQLVSSWDEVPETEDVWSKPEESAQPVSQHPEDTSEEAEFYSLYWELDCDSFRNYVKKNPDVVENGYDSILIRDYDGDLGITTAEGDSLRVLDTADNVMVLGVSGSGYDGRLGIVKNPAQVDLVKTKNMGSYGELVKDYGERYDAVLAMNASGFMDEGGHGTGGVVVGSMVIDGKEYGSAVYSDEYKFCGMKASNDRIYLSNYQDLSSVSEYRWGVQFFPALVVDGKNVVDGSYGMGIQPRACIGQEEDGSVLMLVIDGRQTHSLGCTVAECTKILMRYNCYQAMNLDGGSSALLWYKGKRLTHPSSVSEDGRYLPDCLVVRPASQVE